MAQKMTGRSAQRKLPVEGSGSRLRLIHGLADGQAYSFDLKGFIDDAVEREVLSPSQYLIAVMGGMEVWGGGQGASITGFTAEVQ